MGPKNIIVVKNITKVYGNFLALNNITFTINKGEIFCILGPNGAGKSTLIKIICALIRPTAGEAVINGHTLLEPEKIRQDIGYMSQYFSLYKDLTVFENLKFFAGLYKKKGKSLHDKRVQELLKLTQLVSFKDRLAGKLSGGMRQRLSLAVALIHDPPLLILDEPTAGVDPVLRHAFWDWFQVMKRDQQRTFLVSTHYMDEAVLCDRLALIYQGKIAAIGTENDLKQIFLQKHPTLGRTDHFTFEDVFIELTRDSQ